MLICVCLRILASSRIPDMILGDKPLISEVVLSQRWIRSYLRYYLRLVEDGRCNILENSLLSCHFTTRGEELFKVDVVSFKHLATLLRQGVECGLEDVALVKVESVVVRVFTLHA
jgi:hypothetical protein